MDRFSKGLRPVTAFELEFYLVDPAVFQRSGRMGKDQGPGPDQQQMYSLSELRGQSDLFAEIRSAAIDQGLPIDTIIKEAAPGQFEVNLKHRADAMAAADDTVLLRRLITECAHKHGLRATFMAKPFLEWPGNGMHVHASILDAKGDNIFAGEAGDQRLQHAAAGLLATLKDTLLLYIPGFNGYRRLQPGSYAPTRIAWGRNNRSVVVRVPASDDKARRLEHRMSGADANPYFVLAGVLGGMLEGLENGNGCRRRRWRAMPTTCRCRNFPTIWTMRSRISNGPISSGACSARNCARSLRRSSARSWWLSTMKSHHWNAPPTFEVMPGRCLNAGFFHHRKGCEP
jgi:glutamine synthetase